MPTPPAKTPRKRGAPRKATSEAVKAAAARAEARSAGEEIVEPKIPITPVIITAEVIAVEKAVEKAKIKRRKRRHKFTAPLGKALCKMLASGMTLNEVCRRPLMPPESTVRSWAIDPAHPFSAKYVRAREIGYAKMADQIIDIADHSVNDYMRRVTKDGGVETLINREVLERTRLRIETRKWLLSKALPKMFGDKVAVDHSGTIATPDRPQPTGSDHLADLTKRYATKTPAGSLPPSGPAKAKSSAGLH